MESAIGSFGLLLPVSPMLTISVCNGMGISILVLDHRGKHQPQNSCPCHCFHPSALFQHELTEMEGAFPQLWMLPFDAVGNPTQP